MAIFCSLSRLRREIVRHVSSLVSRRDRKLLPRMPMLVPLRFQLALQTASFRAAAFQGLRDAADLRQVPAERALELMLLPSRRLAAAIRLQAIYRGAVAWWRVACHQRSRSASCASCASVSTCSDEEWEDCDDVNLAASENTQMPSQVPSVNLQAGRVPSFSVIGKEAIRVALPRLDGGTGHEFVLEQDGVSVYVDFLPIHCQVCFSSCF